jgi:hypothetical protein
MPTLDAPRFWQPAPPSDSVGTDTDWPILSAVLYTDAEGPIERPTSNLSFHFTPVPYVESDSMRVRRAVRRAVGEFGPAFDRLGAG